MAVPMIGGPFDGATSTAGDPGVPSIWPRWGDDGTVWFRPRPVPGRPRYDRASGPAYVFAGLALPVPVLVEAVAA